MREYVQHDAMPPMCRDVASLGTFLPALRGSNGARWRGSFTTTGSSPADPSQADPGGLVHRSGFFRFGWWRVCTDKSGINDTDAANRARRTTAGGGLSAAGDAVLCIATANFSAGLPGSINSAGVSRA
jgi:hypothetical protein